MSGARKVFDAEQWATDHEKLCVLNYKSINDKLGSIFKVLWMGLTVLLAVTGWSLKTNYDTAHAQTVALQAASTQIQNQVRSRPVDTTIVVH